MSVETWGLMPKSQDDDETIEEAIARLISEHNENEDAHLGEGQSLNSHKASEIIDHLARSIIQDKIAENQIVARLFKFGDDWTFYLLQSLDSFEKVTEGSGGSIVMNGAGSVTLTAGSAVNNITSSAQRLVAQGMFMENDPVFECRLNDGSDYNGETRMCIGTYNPFLTNKTQIGFRCDQANSKVYAYYIRRVGASYYYTEYLVQNDIFASELYRIEVDSANKLINWYINSELKKSLDYGTKNILEGTPDFFSFAVKRLEVGGNTILHAWNIFFTKHGATEE